MEIAVIFIMLFVWIAIAVGICALFVWICKKIAESKGLPSSYMWFGLLGVIGIIIVAVMGSSPKRVSPSADGDKGFALDLQAFKKA